VSRKKRLLLLFPLGVLAVLIGIPCFLTWREVRQERLNARLIVALQKFDTLTAIDLLKQGADANAHVTSQDTRSFWKRCLDVIGGRHRATPNGDPAILLAMMDHEGDAPPDRPALLQALLDRGAEVNVKTEHGDTPLHLAVWHQETSSLRLLLAYKADVNVRDADGLTPLDRAYSMYGLEAEPVRHLLLEHGADVNSTLPNGDSLFLWAVRYGDLDTVSLFLHHRADLNALDGTGRNVIMIAACNHDVSVLRFLLKKGLPVDTRDYYGWTPLMCACENDSEKAVKILLQHGATVNARDTSGQTALKLAKQDGLSRIVHLLKAAGEKE